MSKEMRKSLITTSQSFAWRIQDDGGNPGRECLVRLTQLTNKAIADIIIEALLNYEQTLKGKTNE